MTMTAAQREKLLEVLREYADKQGITVKELLRYLLHGKKGAN